MTTQQQKDAREILSFVQNQRKKQTDDLLNMWIQFRSSLENDLTPDKTDFIF